jgi:succinate dehydrogenase / fumarate reductase cytochrome b subunit
LSCAFFHHFYAGIRHLAMDVHWMTSLQKARLSSRLVLGLDVLSVSALAFVIW